MSEQTLSAAGLFAVDQIVKTTLALGLAWFATYLLRHRSASARHLVWVSAFIAIFVMPLVEFASPVRIPVFAWRRPELTSSESSTQLIGPFGLKGSPRWVVAQSVIGAHADEASRSPQRVPRPSAGTIVRRLHGTIATWSVPTSLSPGYVAMPPGAEREAKSPNSSRIRWLGFLLAVAVGGALLGLGRALAAAGSLTRIRYVRSRSADIPDTERRELSDTAGLRRKWHLRVASSEWVRAAMTWGVLHPVVLLPASSEAWAAERRRIVLLHELAHVRRLDSLSRLLTLLVGATYWFHPGVWLASRAMRAEAEAATDDAVLRGGIIPSDYAAELLRIAAELSRVRRPFFSLASNPIGVSVMNESKIETRIRAILNPLTSRRRSGATRTEALAIMGAAVLVALSLAAASAQQNTSNPVKVAPVIKPLTASPAPPAKPSTKPGTTLTFRANQAKTRKEGGEIFLVTSAEPITVKKSGNKPVLFSSRLRAQVIRVNNRVTVVDRNGKAIAIIEPNGTTRVVDVRKPVLALDRQGHVVTVRVLGAKPMLIDGAGNVRVLGLSSAKPAVNSGGKPNKLFGITPQVSHLADVGGKPKAIDVTTSLKPVIGVGGQPGREIEVTTQVKPLGTVREELVSAAYLTAQAKPVLDPGDNVVRVINVTSPVRTLLLSSLLQGKGNKSDSAETQVLLQELDAKLRRLKALHAQGAVSSEQLEQIRSQIDAILAKNRETLAVKLALDDFRAKATSGIELEMVRGQVDTLTVPSANREAVTAAGKANLDMANARSQVAQADYERITQLFKAGFIDQGQMDKAELKIREAKEMLDAALAEYQAARAGQAVSARAHAVAAQAQLAQAQAEYTHAQKEYDWAGRQYRAGAVTKAEADIAQARLEVARAELELIKRLLASSQAKK